MKERHPCYPVGLFPLEQKGRAAENILDPQSLGSTALGGSVNCSLSFLLLLFFVNRVFLCRPCRPQTQTVGLGFPGAETKGICCHTQLSLHSFIAENNERPHPKCLTHGLAHRQDSKSEV